LSKYFSNANENKNNEKIDIKIDGINVNNEKKIIYFLLATDPLMFIFCFKAFFVSMKIIIKKMINKIISIAKRYLRFSSFKLTKLLLINVRKVIKPMISVIKKINIKNIFLFKNDCIN
tara:strand:+ start:472 stop:825 length:354 start_codon:yes stop_codon:yes gene_type:complete